MSDYSVKAIFSAEDRGFSKAFEKAGAMAGALSATTGKKLESIGSSFADVGKNATIGFTLPLGLGFKKAVSISSEFESAMTGVRKTTNMTDEEFAKMSKSVQEMSKVLPAGTTEIAGVAEAAGQLGIKKKHLLDFTKTMIDLGYSTNLSSEEGAVALSRFANITQMSQKDFGKLGSTIVDLGNNFATSEAEIVDMGLRLAGTGAQVGLTEAQIMGLSTAMSSVGIRAEMGGSAFSRVMQKMNTAVISGSDKLEGFAAVAGMSAETFSTMWKEKPQEAITAFISGLGYAKDQGLDTISMLKELGINGIREVDTLQRLAGAGDLLSEAFETAKDAWKDNIALAHEADMKYQTFESRMAMVKNRLDIVGKAIGDRLKPIIADFAERLATLAEKFLNLSPGMQDFILKVALIAAAVGPVLLVIGTLAGVVAKAMSGFAAFTSTLKITSAGLKMTSIAGDGFGASLGTVIGKVIALAGKFAPVIAAIALFVGALKLAWEHSEVFRETVGNVFEEIKSSASNFGETIGKAFGVLKESLAPVVEALRQLGQIIGQSLGPVFATIAEIVGTAVTSAFNLLGSAASLIASVFSRLSPILTGIISIFSGLASIIGSVLGPAFSVVGAIAQAFIVIFEFVANLIIKLGDAIMNKLAPVFDFVGNIMTKVGGAMETVGGKISGVMEKIGLGSKKTSSDFESMHESTSQTFDGMVLKANESSTGVLNAFDILRTGSVEKSTSMSTELTDLFTQMSMNMSEESKAMGASVVSAMTEMGIGSVEQANALVQDVGLKWEEMASWTDTQWAFVRDTISAKMFEAEAGSTSGSSDIANSINSDWSSISVGTDQTWDDIKSTISQDMEVSKTSATTEANEISSSMNEQFGSAKTAVETNTQAISQAVATCMSQVSSQTKTDLSNIAASFKTNFSNLSNIVTTAMTQINQSIKTNMLQIGQISKTTLSQMSQVIKSSMLKMSSDIKNTMNQISNEIKNSMSNINSGIRNSMNMMSQSIKSSMNQATQSIRTAMSQMNQLIKTTFTQSGNEIKRFTSSATNTIKQFLTQTLQSTTQGMNAMRQSVNAGMNNIIRELSTGTQRGVQAVNSQRGAMVSAGRNLSYGLASGISYGRSAVIRAAISVATSAIRAARSALGIHSPSTVFREMGINTGKGYIIGNDRIKKKVIESTKSIAQGAIDSFKNVPKSLQSTMDSMMNLKPIRLDNQINSVQTIANGLDMPSMDKEAMSLDLNLHFGNHAFKLLVDDISKAQGKDFELVEAYGY
ncbi:phage tail tape measure protein [Lagierella massiliensis]|uniref:phage tail tape measure protein n=1 Tax=Lagierella massiliensis TaxID=1689303 RepID=UPI0006D7850E|nr:phage tail tape measure protein [Lagierella massiliensis]